MKKILKTHNLFHQYQ